MHELTALEQAARIRSGELDPVELVEHYLDRIDRYGARLGAFTSVAPELALARARAARKRIGEDGLPPLFGVPVAVKDLVGTRDMPTSFGIPSLRDFTPPLDADLVANLKAAGTISLGKLNTAELGLTPYTDTVAGGVARTPWDPARSAGGSSGGSGAAVAAGLVPFAHGNDAAGSIRIPAGVCGVFGFKPSRGRVGNGPAGIDPVGQLAQGPLARTVADAAALLDAMAGRHPTDLSWSPPLPEGETFLGWTGRDPGRLRIGRYLATGTDKAVADPACVAAYEEATELLTGLGHEVVDIDPPFGPAMEQEFYDVWGVRSLRLPVPDESELRRMTRFWRTRGRRTSGEDFLRSLTELQLRAGRALAEFHRYDAVLTPTLALPPRPQEWFTEGDEELELERQLAFSPYTAVHNVTGQPSASLPLHWTPEGLPIGVMLSGRLNEDAHLLALCAQLEAVRPWSGRWPSL